MNYYVYVVFVDKQLKYIGKGKEKRFEHACSGCSTVFGLNRDYFEGKLIEVGIAKDKMSETEALKLETAMIRTFGGSYGISLYNIHNASSVLETFPDMGEEELYNISKIVRSVRYDKTKPYRPHPFYTDGNRGEVSW